MGKMMGKMTVFCDRASFQVWDDGNKNLYPKEIMLPPNTIDTEIDPWENDVEATTSEIYDWKGVAMERRTKWTLTGTCSINGWNPVWRATREAVCIAGENYWDKFEPIEEYKTWRED